MSHIPRIVLLAGLLPHALGSWSVTYPASVQGLMGSCVVLPCTFSYPNSVSASAGIVAIWYWDYSGDKRVVYHSASPGEVDGRFGGRARLLGDPAARNCTLLLADVTPQDSGSYRFRFEIVSGDRWSAAQDVLLAVAESPEQPRIAAPEEVSAGAVVTLNCSAPYACPFGSASLRWSGYDARLSTVATGLRLDTAGVRLRQSLTTSFSWRDHARRLLCELALGSRTATAELVLHVRHAPQGVTATLQSSTGNIRVGDAVSLACATNSSYPPITAYRWYKDGAAVASEQVLTLQHVRREDYGRYHCEAENAVGSGAAPALTLFVFSAEVSMSPAAEVREGTMATLSCDVPGGEEQELNYTWYKNSAWLQEGPARTLLFRDVAVGDAGYYSCKAQNDLGSVTSPAVSLSVTYPPRTPNLALFQEAPDGQLAIVHCTVDSHPPATLSLYHDGALVATSGSQAAPGRRVRVVAARNSLRLEVRAAAPADSGEYRCTARNAAGSAAAARTFLARTARVLVQPAGDVREGDAVTLTCEAARPAAAYAWYKNGRRLPQSSAATLLFPSVRAEDAGAFHCQTRDGDASAAVPLHVLYPPRPPVLSSSVQSRVGVIECSVESAPEARLALLRGREAVACTGGCGAAPRPRLRATPAYNRLRVEIRDVVLQDEGTYVCVASNAQGNASASLVFTAESARVQADPSPRVLEGHAVNLTCRVRSGSAAPPAIAWFRNGLRLRQASGASLVFPRAARSDAGLYHCEASADGVSRSSEPLGLDVTYPPRELRLAVLLDTQRARLAVFQCAVESNPAARLELHRGDELVASSAPGRSPGPRVSVAASPNALRAELRDVTLADEGSYLLTATNAHGTASQRLYFRVHTARVLVAPSTEVTEGDDVSLTCDLLGEPPQDTVYAWFKDSQQVQESAESSLALPRVSSEAAGSYHCSARSAADASASISPSVSLRVFYPPRRPVLTSFLETSRGERGILQCSVDSSPPAALELFKGDTLVASSTRPQPAASRLAVASSPNRLRVAIGAVVMEDEGEYVCRASNSYGNASTAGNFTAGTARLWISPSPAVREGDAVNMTCAVARAGSGGPLTYTWSKDGAWLSSGPEPRLLLRRAAAADAGTYGCTVQSPEGARSSAPRTLDVLYPPRNVRLRALLEAGTGAAAVLACSAEGSPAAALALRRAGALLAASPAGPPPPRGPSALRLELGADADGEYECWASSPLGSARATLSLRPRAVRVVVRPAAEVPEGTEVTLSCEAPGAPAGTLYAWYKNTRWLARGPGAALALARVSPADAGAYSCEAGEGPSARRAPPAALRVLYAPRDVLLTVLVESPGGRRAVLLCTADSHPPAELSLHRGSEPVATAQGARHPRLAVQAAPNALRVELRPLAPEDAGPYECRASNGRGAASASARLDAEPARVSVEPSEEVAEGATATLRCRGAAWLGAVANVTWYKDGRWLRDGPDDTLLLAPVSSDDAGSYRCRVSGTGGTAASAPASLSVTYAPRDVAVRTFVESGGARVGVVACSARSHPRAALTLLHGGRLLAAGGPGAAAGAPGPRLRLFLAHNALRLEIAELGARDAGEYTCRASNAAGSASASAHLQPRALSHLLALTVVAGLLGALVCAAAVAFAAAKLWPRLRKCRGLPRAQDMLELRSKREQGQADGAS